MAPVTRPASPAPAITTSHSSGSEKSTDSSILFYGAFFATGGAATAGAVQPGVW